MEEWEVEDRDGWSKVRILDSVGCGPRIDGVDETTGPDPNIGVRGHVWKERFVFSQVDRIGVCTEEDLWKGNSDSVKITCLDV